METGGKGEGVIGKKEETEKDVEAEGKEEWEAGTGEEKGRSREGGIGNRDKSGQKGQEAGGKEE